MSYCRFGEADVYVYGSSGGFVCDSCRLVDCDFMCKTRAAMLEHLNKHLAAGDGVGFAIQRLRSEMWRKESDD